MITIGTEVLFERRRHIATATLQADRFQQAAQITGRADVEIEIALGRLARDRELRLEPLQLHRHHARAPDDRSLGRRAVVLATEIGDVAGDDVLAPAYPGAA